MTDTGWTEIASPFHRGEKMVQERVGVRERMEEFGRKIVRRYMPEQHRDFYESVPYLMLGSVDASGRPWASMVTGEAGFIQSPTSTSLRIQSRPFTGDPLADNLAPGAAVGLLGILFDQRRRNRMNGKVVARDDGSFTIEVDQSFGNCPQYIQAREALKQTAADEAAPVQPLATLDADAQALIEQSDTLFIATHYAGDGDEEDEPQHGVDVSHRGGKPGFVRMDDEGGFTVPDFAGNLHFNSVGNLLLNPRVGFLFIDFESGDLLSLTGTAEVTWDGEELDAFAGAERLIRFRLEAGVRMPAALPLRWRYHDESPVLEKTGSWDEVAALRERRAAGYQSFEVVGIWKESSNIKSYYLRSECCGPLASYSPGQYLPIKFDVPGHGEQVRTYSLSAAFNPGTYRISVKREEHGRVSQYIHDQLKVGDVVEAMPPRGDFVLQTSSQRPLVLVSAGVGITPVLSMLEHTVVANVGQPDAREVVFVHAARNGAEQAFAADIKRLQAWYPNLRTHVRFSQPSDADRAEERFDSTGRVDADLLRSLLPGTEVDAYICGPAAFMESVVDWLKAEGVDCDNIHYEHFGDASALTEEHTPVGEPATAPVAVEFTRSGKTATWTPESGSLLEFAEAEGVDAMFGCRSGHCGTCAVKLEAGDVHYPVAPANVGEQEVLVCTARPAADSDALRLDL